jgi:hypothetical protein
MAEFSFLDDDSRPAVGMVEYADDVVSKFLGVLETEGVVVREKDMLEPQGIRASADLRDLEYGSFAMQVGTHDNDFVISIWPKTTNLLAIQSIKAKQNNLIMQFIRVLQDYVPDYLRVNIFPPAKEFDVAVFSIKILGAMDALGLDIETMRDELPAKIAQAWVAGSK